jgi:cation diffusion facilitator family transporter
LSIKLREEEEVKFANCMICGRRVGWIGIGVSSVLAVLKLVTGVVYGSHALIALSLYSVTDVLSASIILISSRITSRPPDTEHPYGHGKVEFIAILLESTILGLTALVMAMFFVTSVVKGRPAEGPDVRAIPVAAIAIISCALLYRFTSCVGEHVGNFAVYAHAKHIKADSISAGAVIVGIVIASLGFHVMDSVVAIFETCHIMVLAVEMFRMGLGGLMDSSAPLEKLEEVEEVVKSVGGVKGIDYIRARYIGSKLWVDVDVKISKWKTVNQGEEIIQSVVNAILRNIDQVGNIVVDYKPAS